MSASEQQLSQQLQAVPAEAGPEMPASHPSVLQLDHRILVGCAEDAAATHGLRSRDPRLAVQRPRATHGATDTVLGDAQQQQQPHSTPSRATQWQEVAIGDAPVTAQVQEQAQHQQCSGHEHEQSVAQGSPFVAKAAAGQPAVAVAVAGAASGQQVRMTGEQAGPSATVSQGPQHGTHAGHHQTQSDAAAVRSSSITPGDDDTDCTGRHQQLRSAATGIAAAAAAGETSSQEQQHTADAGVLEDSSPPQVPQKRRKLSAGTASLLAALLRNQQALAALKTQYRKTKSSTAAKPSHEPVSSQDQQEQDQDQQQQPLEAPAARRHRSSCGSSGTAITGVPGHQSPAATASQHAEGLPTHAATAAAAAAEVTAPQQALPEQDEQQFAAGHVEATLAGAAQTAVEAPNSGGTSSSGCQPPPPQDQQQQQVSPCKEIPRNAVPARRPLSSCKPSEEPKSSGEAPNTAAAAATTPAANSPVSSSSRGQGSQRQQQQQQQQDEETAPLSAAAAATAAVVAAAIKAMLPQATSCGTDATAAVSAAAAAAAASIAEAGSAGGQAVAPECLQQLQSSLEAFLAAQLPQSTGPKPNTSQPGTKLEQQSEPQQLQGLATAVGGVAASTSTARGGQQSPAEAGAAAGAATAAVNGAAAIKTEAFTARSKGPASPAARQALCRTAGTAFGGLSSSASEAGGGGGVQGAGPGSGPSAARNGASMSPSRSNSSAAGKGLPAAPGTVTKQATPSPSLAAAVTEGGASPAAGRVPPINVKELSAEHKRQLLLRMQARMQRLGVQIEGHPLLAQLQEQSASPSPRPPPSAGVGSVGAAEQPSADHKDATRHTATLAAVDPASRAAARETPEVPSAAEGQQREKPPVSPEPTAAQLGRSSVTPSRPEPWGSTAGSGLQAAGAGAAVLVRTLSLDAAALAAATLQGLGATSMPFTPMSGRSAEVGARTEPAGSSELGRGQRPEQQPRKRAVAALFQDSAQQLHAAPSAAGWASSMPLRDRGAATAAAAASVRSSKRGHDQLEHGFPLEGRQDLWSAAAAAGWPAGYQQHERGQDQQLAVKRPRSGTPTGTHSAAVLTGMSYGTPPAGEAGRAAGAGTTNKIFAPSRLADAAAHFKWVSQVKHPRWSKASFVDQQPSCSGDGSQGGASSGGSPGMSAARQHWRGGQATQSSAAAAAAASCAGMGTSCAQSSSLGGPNAAAAAAAAALIQRLTATTQGAPKPLQPWTPGERQSRHVGDQHYHQQQQQPAPVSSSSYQAAELHKINAAAAAAAAGGGGGRGVNVSSWPGQVQAASAAPAVQQWPSGIANINPSSSSSYGAAAAAAAAGSWQAMAVPDTQGQLLQQQKDVLQQLQMAAGAAVRSNTCGLSHVSTLWHQHQQQQYGQDQMQHPQAHQQQQMRLQQHPQPQQQQQTRLQQHPQPQQQQQTRLQQHPQAQQQQQQQAGSALQHHLSLLAAAAAEAVQQLGRAAPLDSHNRVGSQAAQFGAAAPQASYSASPAAHYAARSHHDSLSGMQTGDNAAGRFSRSAKLSQPGWQPMQHAVTGAAASTDLAAAFDPALVEVARLLAAVSKQAQPTAASSTAAAGGGGALHRGGISAVGSQSVSRPQEQLPAGFDGSRQWAHGGAAGAAAEAPLWPGQVQPVVHQSAAGAVGDIDYASALAAATAAAFAEIDAKQQGN